MRDKPRLRNYSYETEKTYISWARRYILFHDTRHPLDMGKPELEAFLTHLVVEHPHGGRNCGTLPTETVPTAGRCLCSSPH